MNELITLFNTNPQIVAITSWFMSLSLANIGFLAFIVLNFFSTSLSVSINGNKRNTPKHIISLLTLTLIIAFPNTLWIAALPFSTVLFFIIFWRKAIFIYLNLFMPAAHKIRL